MSQQSDLTIGPRCDVLPPDERDQVVRCLRCGALFVTTAAVITVKVNTERLGFIGPCCLADCARTRLREECRHVEATEHGGVR